MKIESGPEVLIWIIPFHIGKLCVSNGSTEGSALYFHEDNWWKAMTVSHNTVSDTWLTWGGSENLKISEGAIL